MGTKDDILTELKHKEKSVSDLIRFLNIRCDDTPNYSLLLGSGCSITSGIKSGEQLINEWKKEIAITNKIPEDSEEYNKFFESQDWYDDRNPYSSLFEKRYDLQRQRRSFVENEVANKNPSIGYAYLVKLIEQNYFNAVFTTNFDDLLNEAFYRFSNVRPVVCAHDSAISSITITSKRPKIIKLHGDYLFEDIKSTLRETESLEGNMKNKFIEFSKDYGLIVVGYAGNDRSIMDILSYLLNVRGNRSVCRTALERPLALLHRKEQDHRDGRHKHESRRTQPRHTRRLRLSDDLRAHGSHAAAQDQRRTQMLSRVVRTGHTYITQTITLKHINDETAILIYGTHTFCHSIRRGGQRHYVQRERQENSCRRAGQQNNSESLRQQRFSASENT